MPRRKNINLFLWAEMQAYVSNALSPTIVYIGRHLFLSDGFMFEFENVKYYNEAQRIRYFSFSSRGIVLNN